MRRRLSAKSTILAANWNGSTFRFGKQQPPIDEGRGRSSGAPFCSAVDPDFDAPADIFLDSQSGHTQRVTLSEAP